MKKFAVIFAAVWVGFSLVLTGCGNKKEAETKAVLVKTMVVGETAKAESRKFSGTVHGYFESPLAFQVGGRITRRLVSSGDRVTAGQVLMTVDSKDASEQAAAAAGALNAAEAQYRLASSTMARYEKLHELQAISDLAMDQTKNQYELASAQLSQAQAALARAENNLGFTSLTADRDGVVGMTAEVSFDDPQGNEQIMVPLSAMAAQSEQPAVWIVRDHKVYLQKVETGQYGNDTVEIVSGLQKGDRVVTAGVQKLHEGEEVRL